MCVFPKEKAKIMPETIWPFFWHHTIQAAEDKKFTTFLAFYKNYCLKKLHPHSHSNGVTPPTTLYLNNSNLIGVPLWDWGWGML